MYPLIIYPLAPSVMGVVMVSSGEGWGVDRSNGRSYILGPAVNQDPGGNIDKDQIRGQDCPDPPFNPYRPIGS